MDISNFDFNQLIPYILVLLGGGLVIGLILFILLLANIRRINLPPDADILTALRLTPLLVVITLDLLDFSLDFLSAPFAWVLLGRLGLSPLRTVTVLESLIPGTQFLPTMTLAWILTRLITRNQRLEEAIRRIT
jgi:NhaP-type Na+/H+ and K+/H+ antiporter